MTLDEANCIILANRTRKGQADPAEHLRYLTAREVVAKAGGQPLSAGQRAFLAASRRPLIQTEATT